MPRCGPRPAVPGQGGGGRGDRVSGGRQPQPGPLHQADMLAMFDHAYYAKYSIGRSI